MITRTLCNAKESIDMCFIIVVVAVETLLFLFYFPLKYNNDNNTNCKSTKRAFPLFTIVITVIKIIQSIALCSALPISPLLLFLYVVYSMLGAVLFPLQTVGIPTPFVSGLFLTSVSQHLFLGALFLCLCTFRCKFSHTIQSCTAALMYFFCSTGAIKNSCFFHVFF